MKTIPLTQGKEAIVDDEDYEWLNQWKWYASKNMHVWYATRKLPRTNRQKCGDTLYMHQLLFNGIVDHINHDGLDNRRKNLRPCNCSQNLMNRRKMTIGTSSYKGVSWDKTHKYWAAKFMKDGRRIHVGYFTKEKDAAMAYDKVAYHHNGAFAYLNFPIS